MYKLKFNIDSLEVPEIKLQLSELPDGALFRYPNAERLHIKLFSDKKDNVICLSTDSGNIFTEMRQSCKVFFQNKEFNIDLQITEGN
ncbi:MAG: hypothetical protein HKO92_07055 [Flavobacteriaceae bacterium]|nr:hypothetical protein [Flavobacteriaceae bacterium]